jgi:carbonic anhydrase
MSSASQFHLTDNNAMSVLTYGVTGIPGNPITEIRVVGHTDCGGVKACYNAVHGNTSISSDSVLWTWLGPLRVLAEEFKERTIIELTEQNVRVQAENVVTVLTRLGRNDSVKVEGYVYDVQIGADPKFRLVYPE